MTSTGGMAGSTTVLDGTPARSAIRLASSRMRLALLLAITAVAPRPEPEAPVAASSVRCPSGPVSEAATLTASMLRQVP